MPGCQNTWIICDICLFVDTRTIFSWHQKHTNSKFFWHQNTQNSRFSHQNTHYFTKGWIFWHRWCRWCRGQISGMARIVPKPHESICQKVPFYFLIPIAPDLTLSQTPTQPETNWPYPYHSPRTIRGPKFQYNLTSASESVALPLILCSNTVRVLPCAKHWHGLEWMSVSVFLLILACVSVLFGGLFTPKLTTLWILSGTLLWFINQTIVWELKNSQGAVELSLLSENTEFHVQPCGTYK